jgi:hypothetical protein
MMSSAERRTFVLKCDKPRYDGGIEIDLERYFGRRLQPNLTSLKGMAQEHLNEEQLEKLGSDAIFNAKQTLVRPTASKKQKRVSFLSEATIYDLDEALEKGLASEALEDLLPYISSKTQDSAVSMKVAQVMTPVMMLRQDRLKEAFLQGPLQMTIGLTGLLTSALALCSMNLCAKPQGIRIQAESLFQECSKVFVKGLWNTLLLPTRALKATFCAF